MLEGPLVDSATHERAGVAAVRGLSRVLVAAFREASLVPLLRRLGLGLQSLGLVPAAPRARDLSHYFLQLLLNDVFRLFA